MPGRRDAFSSLHEMLRTDGVRAALQYLNRLSVHRFTAVFRFEGGTLRNLHMIDRNDPTVERCPDQPVLDSYCIYVRRTAETFVTESAESDERVSGHPKQKTVRSYCGIPLFEEDGTLFGTICHFDFEPRPFGDEEVLLLEDVAPLLVKAIRSTEWMPERRRAIQVA